MSNDQDLIPIILHRLDSIDGKTDKMIDSQTVLLLRVAQNSQVLDEHQRRSLANEELVRVVKAAADKSLSDLRAEIEPLKSAQLARAMIAKWLAFSAVIAGLAFTCAKLLGALS